MRNRRQRPATARAPEIRAPRAAWPLVCLAFVVFVAALGGRYGFHRDELYFLEAGRHPAWGYADQPPLVPLAAAAWHAVVDGSLWAFRLVPALAGAVVVAVAALTARELGGGRGDATWSAAVVATSTTLLATAHLFGTTVFDVAVSSGVVLLLLRAVRTTAVLDWVAVGVLAALALNIKLLPALLLASCAAALLAVGPRAPLRRPGPWVAAALAAAGVAGTLAWQHANGWPQLALASSVASGGSGTSVDRWLFVPMLATLTGPPVAGALAVGAVALWRRPERRWVPLAAALHVLLTVVTGGKPYYLLPWVPVLVAAAVPVLRRWAAGRPERRLLLVSLVAVNGIASVLIALPVLPPRSAPVALVYDHGEQVGWPELVDAVAAEHAQNPADVVLASNYGLAGALDLARRSGADLPPVFSGHNAYAWWGPPPQNAQTALVVGRYPEAVLTDVFTRCEQATQVRNTAGVRNDEWGVPVRHCHEPLVSWRTAWPQLQRLG